MIRTETDPVGTNLSTEISVAFCATKSPVKITVGLTGTKIRRDAELAMGAIWYLKELSVFGTFEATSGIAGSATGERVPSPTAAARVRR